MGFRATHLWLGLLLIAGGASAQAVSSCADAQLNASNAVEPLENNQQSFSNGKTKLTVIDSGSDRAWFMIAVVSPPLIDGQPTCQIVSHNIGIGFENILLEQLDSSYDPSIGLLFELPVVTPANSDKWTRLIFDLNQATGVLNAEYLGFVGVN